MTAALEVLAIGTRVQMHFPADPIDGIVTAVCIRHYEHVTYEVVWWDGRQRKCEWLEGCELTVPGEMNFQPIGFHQGTLPVPSPP